MEKGMKVKNVEIMICNKKETINSMFSLEEME